MCEFRSSLLFRGCGWAKVSWVWLSRLHCSSLSPSFLGVIHGKSSYTDPHSLCLAFFLCHTHTHTPVCAPPFVLSFRHFIIFLVCFFTDAAVGDPAACCWLHPSSLSLFLCVHFLFLFLCLLLPSFTNLPFTLSSMMLTLIKI